MKTRLKLSQVLPLAEKIKAVFAPACERVVIAGSTRRGELIIGDIEIVAIPRLCPDFEAQLSLFGEPPKMVSALDLLLDKLVSTKDNFRRGDKNGDYYKNFVINFKDIHEEECTIGLDLFLTTAPQWGYILALRTGPADFNKAWVTQQRKGGLLNDRYSFSGGWLHFDGKPIPAPEECDIFNILGFRGQYIEPEDRKNWRGYYIEVIR